MRVIVKNIIPEYKTSKERLARLQNIYNGIQRDLVRKPNKNLQKESDK